MDGDIRTTQEIPDIPEIPDQILAAASRGKFVVFVGAGVSRIIGCRSWEEFANAFIDDLYEKGVLTYFEKSELSRLDSRKILSICTEIYREKGICQPDFKELFKEKPEKKEIYDIYNLLYGFNAIFVTTNYDDHLDKEASRGRPDAQAEFSAGTPQGDLEGLTKVGRIVFKEEELLISNLEVGNVIHIHGSINDQSRTIVTLPDYLSKYSDRDGRLPIFLQEIFGNYTVLFVGYGLEEYEVLEFMMSRITRCDRSISHFILIPFFRNQKNIADFQKKYCASFGIELLAYSIDKTGYPQLAKIIDEWAKQIRPVSRPQAPLDKLRIIDEALK